MLLVDDSCFVFNYFKCYIEVDGLVEVMIFFDLVDVLVCVWECVFDFVLVDYEMLYMDGISFICVFCFLLGCVDILIVMVIL